MNGHRERIRQRYLQFGLDALSERETLELMLFYCLPRRDTRALSQHLMETFGSLREVLEAPTVALTTLGGLTENGVVLLRLFVDVPNRQHPDHPLLTSTEACGDYLLPRFRGQREELVYLLGLDAKCKVMGCYRLAQGSANAAAFQIRRVVELALGMGATSVVLAHNHTSGIAVPSQQDVETTQQVAQALKLVGVILADHLVVADGDYVSMAESGMLS